MKEVTTPPAGLPAPLPFATSAEDILGVQDLQIVAVEVPEWKRTVHLRALGADEGLAINDALLALPKGRDTEGLFIVLAACLVTPDGKLLITTDEQKAQLRGRNSAVLLRLNAIALELQGWTNAADTARKNA